MYFRWTYRARLCEVNDVIRSILFGREMIAVMHALITAYIPRRSPLAAKLHVIATTARSCSCSAETASTDDDAIAAAAATPVAALLQQQQQQLLLVVVLLRVTAVAEAAQMRFGRFVARIQILCYCSLYSFYRPQKLLTSNYIHPFTTASVRQVS